MKPPPFKYYDPVTIEDVLGLLSGLENTKLLAGGQSLLPMLNMRFVLPDHVIDLNRVAALDFIDFESNLIRIGAMVRQRSLEFSPDIAAHAPLIVEAIGHVGHRQTRNRGTFGGSLSHLDPAAELVVAASALDACVTVRGPSGERVVSMDEFQIGYMTPAIDMAELLTSVTFPIPATGHGWGFEEFARRHGDFAIASAAAILVVGGDGRIFHAAVTLGGIGPNPFRVRKLEAILIGERPSDALFAKGCAVCAEVEAMEDALVTAAYRQQLAPVMARRALIKAAQRLGTTPGTATHR
jgi:carbon-monoxide dehydrogenase medium subunit